MTFASFNLPKCVDRRVTALGYTTPTPIQEQAIPPALEGRDIMGLAQTGTGKTAAFVLPILQRLVPGRKRTTRALVIAPTRELAEQIGQEFRSLGSRTDLRCATIYGGVSQGPQVKNLRYGADIVVACPGRLLDIINQGKADLSKVEVLVLDEADRMFDMGFLPDIRRIVRHLPKRKQVMLFSATMPKAIRRLAQDFMVEPVTIQIGHSAPVETVAHALYPVKQHLKSDLRMEILDHTDTGSVLIFTKTKHRARRLDQQLKRAGYSAASLQGNLSQNKRQAAMDGFKKGTFRILVATDIAARGIDVNDISHVINFDVPDTADAYTHRIGRTGRATKNGDAFTLVTPQDKAIVRSIEKLMGSPVERRTLADFDYSKAKVRPRPGPNSRANSKANSKAKAKAKAKAKTSSGPKRNAPRNKGRRRTPHQGGWQGNRNQGPGRKRAGGRSQGNQTPRSVRPRPKYRDAHKARYSNPNRDRP